MEHSEWLYKPSREIKNLNDLELEKQKLRLHQKFLGEMLRRDKSLLQESLSPKNLFNTALFNVFNREGKDGDGNLIQSAASSSPYGKVFKIIKWILIKIM